MADDYLKPLLDLAAAVGTKGSLAAMRTPETLANAVRSGVNAASLPGDVVTGRVDPMSDESVKRALDLAGMMTLGAGAMDAPEGALHAGLVRPKQGAIHPKAFLPSGAARLGYITKDAQPGALNQFGRDFWRLRNRMHDAGDYTEQTLPIRSLISTQETVNPDFVASRVPKNDGLDLPAVTKYNGKYYVNDGHHRIANAAQDSDTVTVRLFDMDRARGIDQPDPRQLDMGFASGGGSAAPEKKDGGGMSLPYSGSGLPYGGESTPYSSRKKKADGGSIPIDALTAQLLRYGWMAPKLDYLKEVPRHGYADGGVAAALNAIQAQLGSAPHRTPITFDDLIGKSNYQAQSPGAYTDAGGQKIAAPFVSGMSHGYPVFAFPAADTAAATDTAAPAANDPYAILRTMFGGGHADGGAVDPVRNAVNLATLLYS